MEVSHILAAGGIVLRNDPDLRIAIVRLRKRKTWVLPKGKLNANESALAAARREVLEETGHKVSIHEFVGALSYESRGKPKVVQFWRMQALDYPSRKLMRDVEAVSWLPLEEAVKKLTHPRERIFLENVGPKVLRTAKARARPRTPIARKKVKRMHFAPTGNEPAATTTVMISEPLIDPTTIDLPSEPLPPCETMVADLASEARVAVPLENVGPKMLRTAKARARPRAPLARKKVSRMRFAPTGNEPAPTTTVMITEPLTEPTTIDLPSEPPPPCQTMVADLASEAQVAVPTQVRPWRQVLERLLRMLII